MVDATCSVCGESFTAQRVTAKYCSQRCGSKVSTRNRGPRTGRQWKLTCGYCATKFTGRSNCAVYCSPECREAARIERAGPESSLIPWAGCEWCGKWFVKHHGRKYCSIACRDINHPRRSKVSPIEYGDCQRCGACFVRRVDQMGAFCSERCAKATRKRNRNHTQRSRTKQGERITLQALGNRDGWTCHLCGKRVTNKPGNSKGSPSMDHLLPLSAGGDHCWTNVSLAHRQCNALRAEQQDQHNSDSSHDGG